MLLALPILGLALLGVVFNSTLSSALTGIPTVKNMTVADSAAGVEVTRVWNKTSGDVNGPIRAGDVVQFHTAVTNKGAKSWTTADPLHFESHLGGLTDDAVYNGARHGTSATYCSPTIWSASCSSTTAAPKDEVLEYNFALKPGSTHYFNHRVIVSNGFLTGDQHLFDTVTISGVPDEGPRFALTADLSAEVTPQHPGLTIVDQRVTKTTGDTNGPIRAGDVLQYHVAVENTGDGDWTAKAAGMDEKLAMFSTDLGGLIDDAVFSRARQGTQASYCAPSTWSVNCGSAFTLDAGNTLTHSFPLKSGAKHYFNFQIQVKNDFAGGDQKLINTVVVAGEPGNDQPRVETAGSVTNTVTMQHPDLSIVDHRVTKMTGDTNGPIRAGELLQYHVAVQNTGEGDWTAKAAWADEKLATIRMDLSELTDDAVFSRARQGTSASYCTPATWSINCGEALTLSASGELEHSFSLKAGAKHYFNFQVRVTNDFLAGDQRLENVVVVAGEPGNGEPRVENSVDFLETVAVQHPDLKIENQLWTKTSGDMNGPIRAGDVLQYHAAVKNTGAGDWTIGSPWADEKLATFTTDLAGLADDAVFVAAREGTSASSCAPGTWSINCGSTLALSDAGELTHSFPLKAGATHYFNYQIRISDSYTGDQTLQNAICAYGEPGNGTARVESCGSTEAEMVMQYPDVSIAMKAERSTRPVEVVRAGDRVVYTITLKNTGDGDWNEKSAWAVGNPLTLTKDLTDILDDSSVTGRPDDIVIDGNDLSWTGPLAAGKSKSFAFTVIVGSQAAGTATDLLMKGETCVTGDTRDPSAVSTVGTSVVTQCAGLELPVGERWSMTKTVFDEKERELLPTSSVRPGDVLSYQLEATAVGGWAIAGAVLTDDLTGMLGVAELQGDVVFQINGGSKQVLRVIDGVVTTPKFELPGSGSALISYQVRVPADVHTGTLHNVATGEVQAGILPLGCGTAAKPCATTHRIYTPAPTIEKTVSPRGTTEVGDTLSYTVRVKNPGPGVWSDRNPLSIVDDLTQVLDDAALQGQSGAEVTVTTSTGVNTGDLLIKNNRITWSGELGAGEWIELSYSVLVNGSGDRSLVNEACTGAPGLERICDESRTSIRASLVEIERPQWGGGEDGCVSPPWIELPITPGVVYTMDGKVEPGGSVTVTATPAPGYKLVIPDGWTPSADGSTASFTVHFPTCESKLIAYPDVTYNPGGCATDGTLTPPSFSLVETEGIDYSYVGQAVAGETIVVTATAQPGYTLRVLSSSKNWKLSADRLTATLTINFPVPECGDVDPGWTGIKPQPPSSTGPTCEVPDVVPSLTLPETEGLIYTVEGEVAVGSSVVVTVVAADGSKLGWSPHWKYSADRTRATWRVSFAVPKDCDTGEGEGTDPENPGGGGGDGGNGGGNGGGGDGGGDGETPDTDPSGNILVRPLPGIPEPVCVSGVVTMPDLKVILVPGVWYEVEGEMTPGGTVVLTAHTLPGYILENTADWMTGLWVVAEDHKSATQTVTFPSLDELCSIGGETDKPGGGSGDEEPDGGIDGGGPDEPGGGTDAGNPGDPGTPGSPDGSDYGSGGAGSSDVSDLAATGSSIALAKSLTAVLLLLIGGSLLLSRRQRLVALRFRRYDVDSTSSSNKGPFS